MDMHKDYSGAILEVSLRRARFQTDKLTLAVDRNQRAVERFAAAYQLDALLTPQARAVFAAMGRVELGHFLEFLQLSIHAGRSSMAFRYQHDSGAELGAYGDSLRALAAITDRPQLLERRARNIFHGLSPAAQQIAATIMFTAWQAARRSPRVDDRLIKMDVVERLSDQLIED